MAVLADTIRNMGGVKMGALAGTTIIMIAFFVMLAFRMSGANMVPLYTSLSLEDSSKIVAELEKTGVPYELLGGGTQISVPADRALRLRMSMAGQGIPSGGSVVGYEIFDRSETFGTSSFVMNINMLRALEGELARTIGSLAGIENARVHLVVPKRELFSRDKDKPSASVTIKMRGGHSLEQSEVTSITHLVSSAVPGLEASKVTVVDSHGRLLARGDGADAVGAAANNAQEMRISYENRMQMALEDLLEKIVGPGKVRVQVAADMNFDRLVINSEKFDPDGQVARSVQSTSQRETAQDKNGSGGGTTSVTSNLPGGAGADAGGSNSNRVVEHTDDTSNFEISKTVENLVKEGGNINKISVAVLVDGNYTKGSDDKETYTPRNEDEIKQIRALVNSAIGFDEKRGDKVEVVNMRFTQSAEQLTEASFFQQFKVEMQSILQTLIIAAVAVLAIMLVLRPAVTQLISQTRSPSERVANELAAIEGGDMGSMPRLPSSGGGAGAGGGDNAELMIDVANIKGGMKSSSVKKINEIVDRYPEETMGVLRQWIMRQS
ncbi:MAG: flagellar basal-body MS-ring/collar protein FliF [Rickettsiales bacterium]|nr:flagellar basal-body MS-ring/collar protein FliF [Rickettsiales bacterium]